MNNIAGFGRLGRSLSSHVMGPLLKEGFRIVLGTDDPGIFPGVTLRSEFKKAYESGLIGNRATFLAIVEESVRANFAAPQTLRLLARLAKVLYPEINIPLSKPVIPRMTGLDDPTESTDMPPSYSKKKETDFKRAMNDYKRGNYQSIEEWYAKYDPP